MELPYAKCRELLASGIVGRVAICTSAGPRIFPVNYSVVGETVVFRTTPYGVLAQHDWRSPIAFEIDMFDYDDHKGWSVLAVGRAERLQDPEEIALVQRTWDPRPWAGGTRPLYIRIHWDELTGRRIGTGWTVANESPVRRTV